MKFQTHFDEAVFFTDRNLGKGLGLAMRGQGMDAQLHKDHFDGSTREESDILWIREVTRRGWVIITKDHNILKTGRPERIWAKRCGATIFCFPRADATGAALIERFFANKSKIARFLNSYGRNFFAIIYEDDVKLDTKN